MIKIHEIIVVEGRDDTAAIKKSVDAVTIETHGYGISKQTWDLIAQAYEGPGIIVFTDPDHAGEQIRRRILKKFPNAKEAFLDRDDATKKDDIGIENAAPDAIEEALLKAHCTEAADEKPLLTMDIMRAAGMAGGEGASKRRAAVGKKLGVGYANTKTFLARLNKFGITEEELMEALQEI
ncbi:MAG: ribonuclease M5 [Eubacterium sp.]|nr:ribonuclease M5 [Candidatus Colimonas fimequi]